VVSLRACEEEAAGGGSEVVPFRATPWMPLCGRPGNQPAPSVGAVQVPHGRRVSAGVFAGRVTALLATDLRGRRGRRRGVACLSEASFPRLTESRVAGRDPDADRQPRLFEAEGRVSFA